MNKLWLRISTRIDAMSLRERTMVFAAVIASVVFLSYALVLSPLSEKQERLSQQISKQQGDIARIEGDINTMAQVSRTDPDRANRIRLAALQGESDKLSADLRAMQESLVTPERIAPLLDQMLRSNGRLRLVGLRTLPVTGLSEELPALAAPAAVDTTAASTAPAAGTAAAAPANPVAAALPGSILAQVPVPAAAAPQAAPAAVNASQAQEAPELVYRHGVEIILQGRYLDMVQYMAQLDALPVGLIWGRASLDARDYPNARLTLTLFTLSLEKDWIKL
jgi:MSHA biogenesis protein MshJ